MSMTVSNTGLMPTSMDQAVRLADLMAKGRLMPTHLQSQPGDCLMVIEQAMRWGMSPFAVAQSTSVISGKLMFEGKLVAAALHGSGALKGRLNYEFSGAGDAREVTASGMLQGEDKPRIVVVRLREVKTTNKTWLQQPDQQLVYSAARVWARRHCPEVMLGVYSPEEMEPTVVAEPYTAGPTITVVPEPAQAEPARRTVRQFLDELETELKGAETDKDVLAVQARADVQKALNTLTNGALARLTDMLDAALARFAPDGVNDGEYGHAEAAQ